jgi:prefoldin alpha subunit
MSDPALAQAQAQAALREAMEAGEALQGHLAGIEEQLGYLSALTQELQRSRDTLEALQGAKKGDEVLLPVGGGNFVRAQLGEAGKVISGVGAGVSVEDTFEAALRRVDAQLEAAKEASEKLQSEGQRVLGQMQALEARMGQLAG